jgi:protein gp37
LPWDLFKYALSNQFIRWIIIGAETGNRKDKVILQREWIENIVAACREAGTPVFMKNSLTKVWGEPLIQEYPW